MKGAYTRSTRGTGAGDGDGGGRNRLGPSHPFPQVLGLKGNEVGRNETLALGRPHRESTHTRGTRGKRGAGAGTMGTHHDHETAAWAWAACGGYDGTGGQLQRFQVYPLNFRA